MNVNRVVGLFVWPAEQIWSQSMEECVVHSSESFIFYFFGYICKGKTILVKLFCLFLFSATWLNVAMVISLPTVFVLFYFEI